MMNDIHFKGYLKDIGIDSKAMDKIHMLQFFKI